MFEFLKRFFSKKVIEDSMCENEKHDHYKNEEALAQFRIKMEMERAAKKEKFLEIRQREEQEFVSSVDASKYLVLDVETNGLSSKQCDLLSIAIYCPDKETMYNRFLPLELNSSVLTTYINGITDEMLKGAEALTQEEVNQIITDFDVDNRTILTYGNIDAKFMRSYFARHKLIGIEKFHFYNFKHDIISSCFSEGNITKDNLCKLFFIDNVQSIHSAENDCILEWKLYQRINGVKLLITNNKVFEFNTDDYIIPVSYLATYPNFKYHMPPLPRIYAEPEVVHRTVIKGGYLKKFATNANGVLIENLINKMVKANVINSRPFLVENKSKLKYVGELESKIDVIPLIFKEDGTVISTRPQDKEKEDEFNDFINSLKKDMNPLIDYIKNDVFKGQDILSQELVVDKDANILALCDLSSQDCILEIKATDYRNANAYGRQMYYESNGRQTYILQVDWSRLPAELDMIISKIKFKIYEPETNSFERKLEEAKSLVETDEIKLINYINKSSHVHLQCKKCGYEWESTYNMALKHKPCIKCHPMVKNNTRKRPVMTAEERVENRALKYYGKITERSNGKIQAIGYIGSKEKVHAKCLICGHEWMPRADHLLDRCKCVKCDKF